MSDNLEQVKNNLMRQARSEMLSCIDKPMSVRLDKNTVFKGRIKRVGFSGFRYTRCKIIVVFMVDLEGPDGTIRRVHVSGLPR